MALSLLPAFSQVSAPTVAGANRGLKADPFIKLLVPLLLVVTFWMAYEWGSLGAYWQRLSSHPSGSLLLGLGSVYSLMLLTLQILRTIFWASYRPYPLAEGPWPTLSVIIPAYNEGAMVEQAVSRVAASDYPADRLEIICIDDGSTDDTWEFIQRACRRYPLLVKAIRFPANRGKKEALGAGFNQGRGEVFITVDSDSLIEPEALRHLVSPLMVDEKMGAVAVFSSINFSLAVRRTIHLQALQRITSTSVTRLQSPPGVTNPLAVPSGHLSQVTVSTQSAIQWNKGPSSTIQTGAETDGNP